MVGVDDDLRRARRRRRRRTGKLGDRGSRILANLVLAERALLVGVEVALRLDLRQQQRRLLVAHRERAAVHAVTVVAFDIVAVGTEVTAAEDPGGEPPACR